MANCTGMHVCNPKVSQKINPILVAGYQKAIKYVIVEGGEHSGTLACRCEAGIYMYWFLHLVTFLHLMELINHRLCDIVIE